MARPHTIRRVLIRIAFSLLGLMIILVLAIQIQLRVLRYRAEHLLADIQSLELRKTSWQDAQQIFSRWRPWTKYDPSCNDSHCSFGVILGDFWFQHISFFSRLSDLAAKHSRLFNHSQAFTHAYVHLGGRPVYIFAQVGMHQGVIWEKDFSTDIHVPSHEPNSPWDEYSLDAIVETKSRLVTFGGEEPKDLILHPKYSIDKAEICESCVLGWAYFTPYADRQVVRRLFQINLSCITSWRSCRSQADIMIGAWPEYLSDDSRLKDPDSFVPCSRERIEVVGRDAENVAVSEIVSFHHKANSDGVILRMIQPLKVSPTWNPNAIEEVRLNRKEIGRGNASDSAWEKPGTHILLAFDSREAPGNTWLEAHECGLMPFGEPALSFFRRGIEQDYAISDPPHWYPPIFPY